jgi:hypothetical protein
VHGWCVESSKQSRRRKGLGSAFRHEKAQRSVIDDGGFGLRDATVRVGARTHVLLPSSHVLPPPRVFVNALHHHRDGLHHLVGHHDSLQRLHHRTRRPRVCTAEAPLLLRKPLRERSLLCTTRPPEIGRKPASKKSRNGSFRSI